MMKPSTLEESVLLIRAAFPVEKLQAWANLPENEANIQAHFCLGMWIRNNWVHPGSPLVSNIRSIAFNIHDDDISSIVIEALLQVLRGEPCPELQELISSYCVYQVVMPLSWD